ncbi:hypothetical protein [Vibrio parahaemolyticus]|uniref:hypothetical protein n=1 Tax=Vibrio parahaemolyticus TaxID=670 RepID=UPI00041A83A6|nr:hypothetical protein [Vibrio parahaemolyticus]
MLRILSDRILKLKKHWLEFSPRTVEFYEPLSDKTQKHKRMVLIISSIVVATYTLDLKITSFGGIQVNNDEVSAIALAGILFWVVLYETFNFTLSFYADLKAWDFKRSVFNADKLLGANGYLIQHMVQVSGALGVYANDLSEYRSKARLGTLKPSDIPRLDLLVEALQAISNDIKYSRGLDGSLEKSITEFKQQVNDFNTTKSYLFLKKTVTYLLDFSIPLVMSLIAMILSYYDGSTVLLIVLESLMTTLNI